MDGRLDSVIDRIAGLGEDRIQNHETAPGLQDTVGFAHDLLRSFAKMVEGERHERPIKNFGCKRQGFGRTYGLEVAVEYGLVDCFPAHPEHRRRTVDAEYRTPRQSFSNQAGKASRTGGNVKNEVALSEFQKVFQPSRKLGTESRSRRFPVVFARMIVIVKRSRMVVLHRDAILHPDVRLWDIPAV